MTIQAFFGWWQLAVCLFAAIGLLAIWWHLGRKQGDKGQVWLACSVFCWSCSGGIEILNANDLIEDDILYYGLKSILSLLNSFFILLSLPWFQHIPKAIAFLVQSRSWFYIILFPFLICVLATIGMIVSQEISPRLVNSLDVLYALVPTLPFLGWMLWSSFAKRQLKLLSWLSLIGILFIVIAQVLKLSPSSELLFSGIFKTTLIMLFFALAMSWVKELAENPIPDSNLLYLTLSSYKNENGNFERQVLLEGYPNKAKKTLHLSRATFDLLLKFAQKKLVSPEDWLVIKPKNDSRLNATYDINDHNQIKRIVTTLLDQLHGKDKWTMQQHYTPLRNALFQISTDKERRIRLAIPMEQITVLLK